MQRISVGILYEDKPLGISSLNELQQGNQTRVRFTSNVEGPYPANIEDCPIEVLLVCLGADHHFQLSRIEQMKLIFDYPEVMLVAPNSGDHFLLQALSNGVSSFVATPGNVLEFNKAIEITAMGGTYLSPKISRSVVRYFNGRQMDSDDGLNSKELEIVKALVDGKEYDELSNFLNISINKLQNQVDLIFKKLSLSNKAEMIEWYSNS